MEWVCGENAWSAHRNALPLQGKLTFITLMWSIFLCNFTIWRTIEIPRASIFLLLKSFCNYGTYNNPWWGLSQGDTLLFYTALEQTSHSISLWRVAQWYKAPLFLSPKEGIYCLATLGTRLCRLRGRAQRWEPSQRDCGKLPQVEEHLQGLWLHPSTTSGGSFDFHETLKNRRQQNKNYFIHYSPNIYRQIIEKPRKGILFLLSLLANCLPWVLISLSTITSVLLPGLTGDLTSFSTLDPHLPWFLRGTTLEIFSVLS